MAFFVLRPWTRFLFEVQVWLLMHRQFWLAIHLFAIVKFVFAALIVGTIVGVYLREVIWLWKVPARANKLAERGELDKAIVLMRRSTQKFTPLLGTRPLYLKRMYRLGQMLETARRTGEANEVWEEILKRPALAHGFEVDVRNRLASGLETLGDAGAAQRQRALAEDRLDRVEEIDADNWSLLLERAKKAADDKRFPEAQILFERALDAPKIGVAHSKRGPVDVEIAARLALAAHQAGDAVRAEGAAHFAIAGANSPFWRSRGLHALALALGAQNRVQEALEVAEAAIVETQKIDNPDLLAESYAQHAMYLQQSGQVKWALYQCEMAIDTSIQSSRTAFHIATICSILCADYEGAREWLDKARRALPLPNPSLERMMQGLFDMEGANVEQAATLKGGHERAQQAWDLLQRAKPQLVGFERVLLWASACEAVGLALLGQNEQARSLRRRVEDQLPQYENDPATQTAVWTYLAKASLYLGDLEEARRLWKTCLKSGLGKPVYRVDALCGLGQCLYAQGHKAEACQCWEEAIALGFDIADTARAREFLARNR